jgi:hypothetical protein
VEKRSTNIKAEPIEPESGRKQGQVMVEYLLVLLSVVLMYFMLRLLLYAFNASSGRVLDLVTWRYP